MDPSEDGVAGRQTGDRADIARRILAAAAATFATQGLGATLADVARRAGVGVGTVYRRFPTKDDLIVELFTARFADLADLARAASDDPDPWAGFVRYFEDSTRILVTDKGFRELLAGAYTGTAGWARTSAPDRLITLFETTEELMRCYHTRLIRRAQDAGALRADIEPTDMLVLTMAIQSTLAFAGTAQQPDLYRRVVGIVLDGLRPSRDQPTPLPVPALTDEQLQSGRYPR